MTSCLTTAFASSVRRGTRQRSTESQAALAKALAAQPRCEQRAVCEVARASGPQALQVLLNR